MSDTTNEQIQAFWMAYLTLVRALHEEGALPIQAIVNRFGQRLDADKTTFREPSNPFAQVMYESLLSLETTLRGPTDTDAPLPPDRPR